MRILITGGAGFIGSHLVEELIRQGCEVRAFTLYNSFGTHAMRNRCRLATANEIQNGNYIIFKKDDPAR